MSLKNSPVVSVVIPMYNVSRYIKTCLDSVFVQTFKNFEVICVDDGCTDDTLALVSQYKDDRLKIIRQKNKGLSAARNAGILAAQGLYVALLDSDDCWDKRKLALHVKHLTSTPEIAVSFCASKFIDESDKVMPLGQYPKLTHISLRDIMCRNPIGNGSAPVIRRAALMSQRRYNPTLQKYEIFNESLRQSEDIEFWLRLAMSDYTFEGIGEALTYYRVNEQGLSANIYKQYQAWYNAIWTLAQTDSRTRKLFSLAKAYQLRYLARRAVHSGNALVALKLIHQAIFCNPRIVFQEPSRTCITYACSLLRLLPSSLYQPIQNLALTVHTKAATHG